MRTRATRTTVATALLLTSTALTAPTFAQTATPAATPATPSAASAPANKSGTFGSTQPTDIGNVRAGATATPDGVTRVDIGGGYMIEEDQPKSRSTVTRDAIAKQSPTANPYQLIDLLPGVNQQSTTNSGLNGGNITLRGFNSNEIGLTIDGAPINDSGNYALYPQEYLDAPNIGQISIAQGYTDLDSPHIGAAGGVVNIYSKDPDKTAGGFISLSGGTRSLQNEFIRLESGQIGRASGFVSYSNYSEDHWRGLGQDQRTHIDAKTVINVGDASKITLSAIYNEEINNSYLALSTSQFANGGAFAPANNYDTTFNAAGTPLKQAANNGYSKDQINPFKNLILTAPSTFAINDKLTVDVTPYFWYGLGNGGGTTALSESGFYDGGNKIVQDLNGNGVTTDKLLYYSPSTTETFRPGIIAKATYQFENHRLVAGAWYEAASQHQYGSFSPLNADGTPVDVYSAADNLIIATGPLAGQKLEKRNTITNTYTKVLFVGDTATFLDDRLTVDAGIKQAFVTRDGNNMLPAGPTAPIPQYLHFNDTQTLPTLGVSYKLDDHNQIFAGVSTTFKTPANYALFGTVSATSGAYTPPVPEKDETAVHAEIGHRYQGEQFDTAVTLFGYQMSNRQQQTNYLEPGSTSSISVTTNVGSTTSYGLDAEIGTHPINNIRGYASVEFLHDVLDGNLPSAGTLNGKTIADNLPTKGKFVPGEAAFSAAIGLDYDDGHWFGNASVKYIGRQFGSYTNDDFINGYARLNAGIGYRFDDYGYAKAPTLRLNLYNLADQTNLTGVYTSSTNTAKTTGIKGSSISSSGAYYYVGQGFSAIVTLSAGF